MDDTPSGSSHGVDASSSAYKKRKSAHSIRLGTFDKSRIIRQEPMSVQQVLHVAATEGLELLRATEGKGTGKGAGSVTGFRGVVLITSNDSKPFRAQVCVPNGGGTFVLGSYATPEEAALSYARNKHLVLPENLLPCPPTPEHVRPLKISTIHSYASTESVVVTNQTNDGEQAANAEGSDAAIDSEAGTAFNAATAAATTATATSAAATSAVATSAAATSATAARGAPASISSLLPAANVRKVMKRAMGPQGGVVSDEAVAAVQRCTSEFLSFVVSEARSRVSKEGREKEGGEKVSYADIMAALAALGFKCAQQSSHAASP